MTGQDIVTLIQKKYRKKFLAQIEQLNIDFELIAKKMMVKVSSMARRFEYDGRFRKGDLQNIKTELNIISYWLDEQFKSMLDGNIKSSTELALKGHENSVQSFLKHYIDTYRGNERELFQKALSDPESDLILSYQYGGGLPTYIRNKVYTKRWDDGFVLSDRIWVNDTTVRKNLNNMIETCINEGRSAVEFSKAVEEYLLLPEPSWTTAIKPSITGRGSVKYNALRLARTETNQAYWQTQILADQQSGIVTGIKRNLSERHPVYPPGYEYKGYNEICNYMAEHNHHGMGPGVFPKNAVEPDHPNGLCFLTSVMLTGDNLRKYMENKYGKLL